METGQTSCVKKLTLTADLDKRVALATVRVGDVLISGIAVWRSASGKLWVYFPSHKAGSRFEDTVTLPPGLRSAIEAEVIAAYKSAKGAEKSGLPQA